MRIAAIVLIVVSALACLLFAVVATALFVPANSDTLLRDPYYEVAAARVALLPAFLALLNGIGLLRAHRRRRPGALWLVFAGALLLLVFAAWFYLSLHAPARVGVPSRASAIDVAAMQREQFFRWYLACAGLALTLIGWAAWRVNQRITLNLDRG